ncbi:tyrosine-type recombinase/integrase [Maricaulaceae bacterium NA33B04]|nr:tyrosine-type recombinase/integrase [Maricaulaceae bacterium NA33B04]
MNSKIYKRGKGYALKVYIPMSLQHLHKTASGKPQTERSKGLGTRDYAEARRRAVDAYRELVQEIYVLPDPISYQLVKPYTEEQTVYKKRSFKSFDAPMMPKRAVTVQVSDHPELTDVAEEIKKAVGEKEARKWLAKARKQLTVTTAPEEFREFCDGRNSPSIGLRNTRERHQKEFADWLKKPDIELRNVTLQEVDRYVTHLHSIGAAPNTINSKIGSLFTLWRWSKKRSYVTDNIWEGQTVKAEKVRQVRPFTEDEISRIRSAKEITAKPKHIDLVTLLLFTGCRIEEICSLTREQVTRSNSGEINGITVVGGKPGAAAKDWIPVVAPSALAILERRANVDGKGNQLFHDLKPGAQGYSHNVAKTLRRAIRKALGLPLTGHCEVDNHSFRRTYATAAENAGVSLEQIDRLQRRKTKSMAGDTYSTGPNAKKKTKLQKKVTKKILASYWT